MDNASNVDWIDAFALVHGTMAVTITTLVSMRYLFSRTRVPMLLISASYIMLTLFTVRAISIWGKPNSIWFWVAITGWVIGDLGLSLYVLIGPPPPRKPAAEGAQQ